MRSRNLLSSVLLACLLAVGFLFIAPTADAGSARKSSSYYGEGSKSMVIKVKRRRRGPRIRPIGPAYIYYDFPYYYSRGYYPRHIGPGFVYHGQPYSYYNRHHHHPKYGG